MSNTNKNGPSKFKIENVTRISIMLITHTVVSKILIKVICTTFISVMAVTQKSLGSTRICFPNSNDSSFMIPTAI